MEKALVLEARRPDLFLPSTPSETARVSEALVQVLSSQTFRTAAREKTFLDYVVNRTIQGRADEIKEYTVATEAFGRGDSFDPRNDTIVRTEARNVRRRLATYYAGEGRLDPLRIELPKGGYVPQFIEVAPAVDESAAGLLPVGEEPEQPAAVPTPAFDLVTAASEEDPAQVTAATSRRRPWIRYVTAVGALIVVAVALFLAFKRPPRRPATGDTASIAVLPFVYLGIDDVKEGEILSDGLTEELIDALARIPQLHVVARSSVFLYKGKSVDVRDAGRQLRVRNVLEGSVRIANGHIRILTRLEDAADGDQIWSASFDRKLDDVISLQEEISAAITQSLGVQLAGAASLKSGAAPSAAAYRDFLRGLYFLNRYTAENVRTGINYFERALAADPNLAPAYCGLAEGLLRMAVFTSTPAREIMPPVREAASKALALDGTLGEAHLELARADTYEWKWEEGQHEYLRALDLSPSSADVHIAYAYYLLETGHLDQALAQAKIGLDLDPISPQTYQFNGRVLYYLGRYDAALELIQKGLTLDSSMGTLHQALGLVYLARPSTYLQGVAESERAMELMEGDPWTTSQIGYAYALAGRTAEARGVARQLEKAAAGSGRALPVARVYAGLGDRNLAFMWLQRAVDQRDVGLLLLADPVYRPLRTDPRFQEVLNRANLSPAALASISIR